MEKELPVDLNKARLIDQNSRASPNVVALLEKVHVARVLGLTSNGSDDAPVFEPLRPSVAEGSDQPGAPSL